MIGFSGSVGTMGSGDRFFKSALSKNIIYCIYDNEKSVNEIADILSVSPVYVESELEFLEEYSLVINNKGKYIANILIEENTREDTERTNELYSKVSSRISHKLLDEIIKSNLLEQYSDEYYTPDKDINFLLWSILFYSVAWGCEIKEDVSFEEAATRRADGGNNIIVATVKNDATTEFFDKTRITEQCGPCWNGSEELKVRLWLMDWPEETKRVNDFYGGDYIIRDLQLLKRFINGEELSKEDYAYMVSKHYVRKNNGSFELSIVSIKKGKFYKEVILLAQKVMDEVLEEMKVSINSYKEIIIRNTPKHLRKSQLFLLQNMFHSDGLLMNYMRRNLIESRKLKPVSKEQQDSLSMMLIYWK